jgi:proline iminopeptidase
MRAHIRGIDIFFDVDGAGLVPDGSRMHERPTAFLINGGPGSDHTGYKARYGQLKDKVQIVYFDHRGHGRSANGNPQTYTLDENVEDMEALRRYLGLGPIVSIGASYGGMVAMAHAARYPDSVSHLVLLATAAHAGLISRAKEIVAERGSQEQIAQCNDLFAGRLNTEEKLRRYYEVMGPLYSRKSSAVGASVGLARSMLSPEALNRAWAPGGSLTDFDLRPELGSIVAPTLVLGARHDWVCAPEFSEEIHRLIPGSDLRIFEESGHQIGADEPENMLAAVAGFLVYRTRRDQS